MCDNNLSQHAIKGGINHAASQASDMMMHENSCPVREHTPFLLLHQLMLRYI